MAKQKHTGKNNTAHGPNISNFLHELLLILIWYFHLPHKIKTRARSLMWNRSYRRRITAACWDAAAQTTSPGGAAHSQAPGPTRKREHATRTRRGNACLFYTTFPPPSPCLDALNCRTTPNTNKQWLNWVAATATVPALRLLWSHLSSTTSPSHPSLFPPLPGSFDPLSPSLDPSFSWFLSFSGVDLTPPWWPFTTTIPC